MVEKSGREMLRLLGVLARELCSKFVFATPAYCEINKCVIVGSIDVVIGTCLVNVFAWKGLAGGKNTLTTQVI